MKKSWFILVVWWISCFSISHSEVDAQSLTAGCNAGIGFYSMHGVKALQQYRIEYAGLPAEVTEDFPPFWTSGVEIGLSFPTLPARITWFYQYASTGARANATDYSGQINLDLVANCNQLGTSFEYDFFNYKFFSIGAGLKVSYMATEVKTTDYLEIYGQSQTEEYRFISHGGGGEPGLSVNFRVAFLRFSVYGGYLIGFSEGLRLPGTPKGYLNLPNGEKVVPDWSGVRVEIKLNLVLELKKNIPVQKEE